MRMCFRVIGLLLPVCLLPISLMAQSLGQSSDVLGNNPFAVIQQFWVVAGKVKTLQGVPVRGATVTVTPLISAGSKLLTTDAQGEFHTQYQLMAEGVNEFSVLLTVKKKGLQTAHAYVDYGRSARTFAVPVTLHGLVEDADLLSSADLVNTLAPRLKQLGPAEGLAEKSQKDYTKGVDFFSSSTVPSAPCPFSPKWRRTIPRASAAGPCWAWWSWLVRLDRRQ